MQRCIACNEVVVDAFVHTLLACPHWAVLRNALYDETGVLARRNRKAMYSILKLMPTSDGFFAALHLVAAIDATADAFWRQ